MKIAECFKVFFLLLVLTVSTDCGQTKHVTTVQNLRSYIVTPEGKPSESLKALFECFKIKTDGTLQDMAKKAQEAWPLIPPHLNYETMNDKMDTVKPLVKKLGFIDPIDFTSQKDYTYALVFSGHIDATCARIKYLVDLWKRGIRFENIIVLTSQRDLHPIKWDSLSAFSLKKGDKEVENRTTEYDLLKILYDHLDLPQEFKKIPVSFVSIPKKDFDFTYHEDQVKAWLVTNPKPGACLVVTNQPYVPALNNMLHNLLPRDFDIIDVVGYSVGTKHDSVSMWLGALSWWLYEECLRQK
jgi:hypothetical protein